MTGGLFSGFTRLSKGLAAVLVTGYVANAFFPNAISGTFSLIPGRFIPYVWNIITPGYLETSIFGAPVAETPAAPAPSLAPATPAAPAP
ncbi:hypothetical protein KC19_4G040100 [Ceratodon purpureus]|uniref:Uncharacterized protein n=1 Tax=Ceratodon purpureus TaxID=3225 RepID=A0A8T0I5C3_CERPU|nr:hypothetical protein KC19_4G040100 [Ceratodon purpureus]